MIIKDFALNYNHNAHHVILLSCCTCTLFHFKELNWSAKREREWKSYRTCFLFCLVLCLVIIDSWTWYIIFKDFGNYTLMNIVLERSHPYEYVPFSLYWIQFILKVVHSSTEEDPVLPVMEWHEYQHLPVQEKNLWMSYSIVTRQWIIILSLSNSQLECTKLP